MGAQVSALIEAARDGHWSFDENASPDRTVLRLIDRYQKSLYLRAVDDQEGNPDPFLATHEIDFPLVDHEEGEALPAHVRVLSPAIATLDTGDKVKVYVVAPEAREDVDPYRRMYLAGTELRPVGEPSAWEDVVLVKVQYIPACPTLSDVTDTPFMADADPVLIAAAANFLAGRASSDVRINRMEYAEALDREEASYLTMLRRRRRARPFKILPVW